MNELERIETGTVEKFLSDINKNFTTIQNDTNITRKITFVTDEDGLPTDGASGDICIVYE